MCVWLLFPPFKGTQPHCVGVMVRCYVGRLRPVCLVVFCFFFTPHLHSELFPPVMLFVVPAALSLSPHPAVLRPVGWKAGPAAVKRACIIQHIPLCPKHFLFCLPDVCNYPAVAPRRRPGCRHTLTSAQLSGNLSEVVKEIKQHCSELARLS